MDQYFSTPIDSYHTCRCAHQAYEHTVYIPSCCSFEGSCNVKSCGCRWYDPYVIFISQKTGDFKTMDHLFYEIGVNLLPANAKKMSYNALLDGWIGFPIPDSTFDFWKIKGYFKKGNNKLNYGILLGPIHRGINKGKFLKDMNINYDINKGTVFLPLFRDKR